MAEEIHLHGPVEKIGEELVLRILLEGGGDQLIDCSKGISRVEGEYLTVVISEWMAACCASRKGAL